GGAIGPLVAQLLVDVRVRRLYGLLFRRDYFGVTIVMMKWYDIDSTIMAPYREVLVSLKQLQVLALALTGVKRDVSSIVGWSVVLFLPWPQLVWAVPPMAFDAVHYNLDVTYDVPTHTLHGVVSCTAVWQGADPLIEVYFFPPPNTLSRPDPREPA